MRHARLATPDFTLEWTDAKVVGIVANELRDFLDLILSDCPPDYPADGNRDRIVMDFLNGVHDPFGITLYDYVGGEAADAIRALAGR